MPKRLTNAQLQAQIEALRHNADLLEVENARLRAEIEALRKSAPVVAAPVVEAPVVAAPAAGPIVVIKPLTPRTARPVFEFDPSIPGDFARAAKLAREFKGCTRRCA